jgi:hypothetical protein
VTEERTNRLLDDHIRGELQNRDSLPPPWKKYPDMERFSSFWRMGDGEWYLMMWFRWTEKFNQDQMLDYFRLNQPIPVSWLDWVSAFMIEGADLWEDPEPGIRRLEELGLADLLAWREWWDRGGK